MTLKYFSTPILLVSFFFICGCQSGNEDIRLSVEDNTDGWIILFDGESTEHWRGYNMDTLPDGWIIEGDQLVLNPIGDRRDDIITKDLYDDFEFRAEYNISESGNSGIFHHVIEQPGEAIFTSGPEMQILDNEAFSGFSDLRLAGSLYDLKPANPQNARPAGEWNTIRIISDGPNVEYWQNGEKIVVFERWTSKWFDMVRDTKFECHPSFGTVPKGHIGLQNHGSLVRFRNIKIRSLN